MRRCCRSEEQRCGIHLGHEVDYLEDAARRREGSVADPDEAGRGWIDGSGMNNVTGILRQLNEFLPESPWLTSSWPLWLWRWWLAAEVSTERP